MEVIILYRIVHFVKHFLADDCLWIPSLHLYTMHIQPLQDRYLALGVLVLVLVDVVILLVYTTVEGVRGNLTAIPVLNRENLMNVEGVGWYMCSLKLFISSVQS